MPLSEHEQRLLDQIERALYAEDPKFASTVRSTDLRTHMRRRMRRAGIVLVLGFVLLLAGAVTTETIIGVIGFLVMLVALGLFLSAWKRLGTGATTGSSGGGGSVRIGGSSGGGGEGRAGRQRQRRERPAGTPGGLRGRLEERWKRRWEERGGER